MSRITAVQGFDGLPRLVDLAVGQTSEFQIVVPDGLKRAQLVTTGASGDLSPMRVFASNKSGVADASNLVPVGRGGHHFNMADGSYDSACVTDGHEGAAVNMNIDGTSPAKVVFSRGSLDWHCKAGDTIYLLIQPKKPGGEDYKALPAGAQHMLTPNRINV